MTTSRSRPSDADAASDSADDSRIDDAPELNVYEIHSERTVLTEPGNTDGWIASDTTVTPSD
ncbi:hypothetical protein ACFQAS_05065 [Halopenitus salinus]|jgi:hypothetical protein|uniref:Uncharacterized protein n=1 Tax=Halopenitus salinus TaxID=1198295 RepID=A0ABD5UYU8_9EURY